MVKCHKVTVEKDQVEEYQLVQYDTDDLIDRRQMVDCVAYLTDCGMKITIEPHEIVGPDDDPAVGWGDFVDIVAPADR